jgi:hypothetical protein
MRQNKDGSLTYAYASDAIIDIMGWNLRRSKKMPIAF